MYMAHERKMKRLHALNGYQEATLGTHYIHNEYFLAV
jgi:hypothetical protein